ncbi:MULTISPECIES: MFS transporter [Pseudonocardia]|uniref:Antiseptic resistance protein n=2 Tax=Pseudonocardia TaxID=1847 RepID=A0A1Y2N5S6_PSEAH|nr:MULTISPECIES: MFS transporter [Pseudonocardia]OSY42823.1 Antiseptic resistance protein [Pseudonocardia autotrophica]TDN77400.1 EmrB/QacA subfamily drug resistance transporter [Pseudonocardia autotrophica]BBG01424.1 MFS transporter [Pseudonocardia autotrophica]GEC24480.1 MFS transporter [Pseudonocardia saturnea]
MGSPSDTRPYGRTGGSGRGRRVAVVATMGLALFVIVLNNSSLNIAIPTLMRDLGAGLATVQWIVDAYSVVFAGLLLAGGACADRWGRKRVTLAGVAVFGAASAVAALADTAWQVVLARVVLGAAAAFVMPGTLAVLIDEFTGRERATAIAIWSGVASLGVAAGPLLGGLVTASAGWAAVFWLNVAPAAVVVVAGALVVRESSDPARGPVEIIGAALSVLAVGSLVFAVIEFGALGYPAPPVVAGAVVAVVAAVAFAVRHRRAARPLVPRGLLRDGPFLGASVGNMLLFFGLAGSLFVLTQRLQFRFGLDPVAAGLAVAPVALTVVLASVCSPVLVRRCGDRVAVAAGLGIVAGGLVVLAAVPAGLAGVLAGLAVVGTGFGVAVPAATGVLVSRVPEERAGAGAALNDTMQELGFALGIAVVGATLNRFFTASLGADADRAATLHSEGERAAVIGGEQGALIVEQAGAAFDRAATAGLFVAAAAALVAAVLTIVLIPARVGEHRRSTP